MVVCSRGMVHGSADLAVGCDDDVLDVVEPLREGVHHRVHLAGVRVDLGVGGEGARQGAEEVVAADGLELVVSSTGHPPASTIAHVVPAKPPTLVFGPPGESFQFRPGMSGRPRASLRLLLPT
jgi:hypothetical protein